MPRFNTLITLTALGLAGCQDVAEQGTLEFCSTFLNSGTDTVTVLNGEVTAIDAGTLGCTHSVTLTDESGTEHTVGLTVTGRGLTDITPSFDVDLGDQVTLQHHYKMVWGSTEGFVLSDDDGLVMAMDEGNWGGALADADLDFSVNYSEEAFLRRTSECLSTDYFDVDFTADNSVEVIAGTSDELFIDGELYTATAITAKQFGPGKTCSVSDKSDYLTWVVSR